MSVLKLHINHFTWLFEEYSLFAVFNLSIVNKAGQGPLGTEGKPWMNFAFLVRSANDLFRAMQDWAQIEAGFGIRNTFMAGSGICFLVGGRRGGEGEGGSLSEGRESKVANVTNSVSVMPMWNRYED